MVGAAQLYHSKVLEDVRIETEELHTSSSTNLFMTNLHLT